MAWPRVNGVCTDENVSGSNYDRQRLCGGCLDRWFQVFQPSILDEFDEINRRSLQFFAFSTTVANLRWNDHDSSLVETIASNDKTKEQPNLCNALKILEALYQQLNREDVASDLIVVQPTIISL